MTDLQNSNNRSAHVDGVTSSATGSSDPWSTRHLATALVLLWLAGNALRLPILAVPPVLVAVQTELKMSGTEVGILSGLPVVLFALVALPGSLLIARIGAVPALIAGLISAAVGSLCHKYGTLFIADEIQTGVGRTGRFLAVEHWGVEPDMVLLSKTLSGGHVPIAAVLTRKWILDKVFDRMERAVVPNLTFAGNDLAMAAGLATLEVIESEHLIENAATIVARLLTAFQKMALDFEMISNVRGKGLLLGIEFGPPRSLKLRAGWSMLEAINTGLFCQIITIPLCKDHHVLAQVSGHASHTVKLLPAMVLTNEDCDWIERSFQKVISDSHQMPSAVWSFGRTLAAQAWNARAATGRINAARQ